MVLAFSNPNEPYLVTPCLKTDQQILVLVKPSFASGSFGHCSVWAGANDHKLYVRKLMTTSGHGNVPPKDISCHLSHLPMVPNLVTFIVHQAEPQRVERQEFKGYKGEYSIHRGDSERIFWSAIYEYIPGKSLLSVYEEAREKGTVIPERIIWEFGKTMLEFLRHALFPEELSDTKGFGLRFVWNHNDLYFRNIIVSNDDTGTRSCNFHVIDFGRLTSSKYTRLPRTDLRCVGDMLDSLMRCHIKLGRRYAFRDTAAVLAMRDNSWPYSGELNAAVDRLWKLVDSFVCFHYDKQEFAKLLETFQTRARQQFERFTASHHQCSFKITNPIPVVEAKWWLNDGMAYKNFRTALQSTTGCLPCKAALVQRSAPPETWRLSDEEYWGRPEFDPENDSDT